MGATRPASGKYATFIWQSPYFLPFSIPTRDASPPLEVALGGSVSGNLKCPQNGLVLDVFFEHPACKGKSIAMWHLSPAKQKNTFLLCRAFGLH